MKVAMGASVTLLLGDDMSITYSTHETTSLAAFVSTLRSLAELEQRS